MGVTTGFGNRQPLLVGAAAVSPQRQLDAVTGRSGAAADVDHLVGVAAVTDADVTTVGGDARPLLRVAGVAGVLLDDNTVGGAGRSGVHALVTVLVDDRARATGRSRGRRGSRRGAGRGPSHVVDVEVRREDTGAVRIARPASADGQVQDHKERAVELVRAIDA